MKDLEGIKTVRQLRTRGVLSLVEKMGGQLQMLTQIKEAQQRGELTDKQAFDLRDAISKACQTEDNFAEKEDR